MTAVIDHAPSIVEPTPEPRSTSEADVAALVRILQDAHAGELAAAYAYRGHARALWRRPAARAEVQRIEAMEWHHRNGVAVMLTDLGARPRRPRELLMATIGRLFGSLCFIGGFFGPMYAAGRLEGMNVDQYRTARDLATTLGGHADLAALEEMRAEELRHEQFFGDQIRHHWLLPPARAVLKWTSPPAADPSETDR